MTNYNYLRGILSVSAHFFNQNFNAFNYFQDIEKCLQVPSSLQYEKELTIQLKNLDEMEKRLIRKKFQSHIWQVGSVRMFGILKPLSLASISDYLLELYETDPEKILYILNDFLEANFALISDLIMDTSPIIQEHLSICFEGFINDVITNPESIKVNFLEHIDKFLNETHLQNLHFQLFDIILDSKIDEKLELVIKQQKKWNVSYEEDDLITKILKIFARKPGLLDYFLQKIVLPTFNGWFYLLFTVKVLLLEDVQRDDTIKFFKS